MLALFMVVGLFNGIQTEAKEISIPAPKIKVKTVNNGTGIKITISKNKDTEDYEIYATCIENSYSGYTYINEAYQKIATINKNGNAKRTITLKSLPAGSYKIKVRACNRTKYGTLLYGESKEKSVKVKDTANGYTTTYDFSKVKKGDIIKFGSYEQDGNYANGKEPIEWIVVEKTKKQVLLLSKYALDCLQYNPSNSDDQRRVWSTWEDCTLRKWLNEKFYECAFNKTEKGMVKTTTLENFDNVEWGSKGGNDTEDKVFLLSQLDMINSDYGFEHDYEAYDVNRRCAPTAYAAIRGAWASAANYQTKDGEQCTGWWLRSPGSDNYSVENIDVHGEVKHAIGVDDINGVRPALYISLK